MIGLRATVVAMLALAGLAGPLLAGDDAPSWLREAAAPVPAATLPRNASAYVLLNENATTVEADGRHVTTERRVVKVLDRQGRSAAAAHVAYENGESRVREIRAWLLRPSGAVKKYDKSGTIDRVCLADYVFDECRVLTINAADDADVGGVFGYEAVVESRPLFGQDTWAFQESLGVKTARFTLTLPDGWHADGRVINHPEIAPAIAGRSTTWELHDLPPIADEPMSPPVHQLSPRLALSLWAPDAGTPAGLHTFKTWADVARWYGDLAAPQAEADAVMAARVRELTAGADDRGTQIRAIARHVQATNYAAVEIGIGRYKPHAATDVFAKSYGDCKDKANLMRALLKIAGIRSHLVLIYSGDPGFVHEDWVSPLQFNHAVLAVELDEPLAARVEGLATGPLVIFDPTDPFTPFGELPESEQGSLALIAAGSSGALVRMPLAAADANATERQMDVDLGPNGELKATLHESSVGDSASHHRALFGNQNRAEYTRFVEKWINRCATAALVEKIEPTDDPTHGRFTLDVAFNAAAYGQLLQGRLLLFKPFVFSRLDFMPPGEASRRNPVLLASSAFAETVRVKLPAGFKVDELPAPVRFESAFGSYQTTLRVAGGELIVGRRLVVKRGAVPADQYAAVRDFFQKIRTAETTPVVLARN